MSDPNRQTISNPFIDGMAGVYAAEHADELAGQLAADQAQRDAELDGGPAVMTLLHDRLGGRALAGIAITVPAVGGAFALSDPSVAVAGGNVKQECVHVGLLAGEHIVSPPELLRAGHPKQMTDLQIEFDPMPALCHGLYNRINRIQYEMTYKGQWRDMAPSEPAIYSQNRGTEPNEPLAIALGETGHAITPDGFTGIWHRGDKVRVVFTNKVTQHGKVVGQKEFTKPVKISPNS